MAEMLLKVHGKSTRALTLFFETHLDLFHFLSCIEKKYLFIFSLYNNLLTVLNWLNKKYRKQ
jgi:hypothetical protein